MLRHYRQRYNTFVADRITQYMYEIAFTFWSLSKSGIKHVQAIEQEK